MNGIDLSSIPLEAPPAGQQSNLLNGPSRAWMPRVAIYTTLPFAILSVAMRFITRFRVNRGTALDDYLCLIALLASCGFCGLLLNQMKDDMYGRHFWDIPVSALTLRILKETVASTVMYSVAAALTKVCLLALFYRLFSRSRKSKHMIIVGITFIGVAYFTVLVIFVYYGVPHPGESGWTDPGYLKRSANDSPIISIVISVIGIVTDFYVITIPATAVFSLQLSARKKLGVCALFALGLIACCFCVGGLVPRIFNYQIALKGRPDPLWTSAPSYALAVAEINLGIICGCIPVVVPLFKEIPTFFSTSSNSVWERYLAKARSRSIGSDGSDFGPGKSGLTRPDRITVTHTTEVSKVPASDASGAAQHEKYFV